jgi:hypothetical protein
MVQFMNDAMRVIGVTAGTTGALEREVALALRDVPPEHVRSISYSATRLLGIWLQHHELIVLRGPQ